jgi:hypothetical protein
MQVSKTTVIGAMAFSATLTACCMMVLSATHLIILACVRGEFGSQNTIVAGLTVSVVGWLYQRFVHDRWPPNALNMVAIFGGMFILCVATILCVGSAKNMCHWLGFEETKPHQDVWVSQLFNHSAHTAFPAEVNARDSFDVGHLKKAIAPDMNPRQQADITIYAPDEAHGELVVLPGGAQMKYKKVTKQSTALEANTEETPYLFELPKKT